MKKAVSYLFSVAVLLFFACGTVQIYAQSNFCATGNKMIPENDEGVVDLQRIRENIQSATTNKKADTIIFPTVVHIVHLNGNGNISDAQVLDGLRVINEDFNRMNADTTNTRDYFKPYAANVGYKFELAKLDSNGDSTTAIVRIDTSLLPHPEPVDPDFDNVKFITHWPADMYYNIWVVRDIQDGVAGYAQYPGTNFTYGGPWETWGIVVEHTQWGTIGTSFMDGRTGTHEIGHTFGLYHTFLSFSDTCGTVCDTTGDEVCDTPPAKYSFSCPTLSNTCSNDTSGPSPFTQDSVDQIENYMGYNSCQNMFSEGQKTRMNSMIASFPLIQGLSADSNLIATGLMLAPVVCACLPGSQRLDMKVLPNPTQDRAVIKIIIYKTLEDAQLLLTDMYGRIVLKLEDRATFTEGTHNIDIQLNDRISPGVYNLILQAGEVQLTRKLIKVN